jgi:cullin 1
MNSQFIPLEDGWETLKVGAIEKLQTIIEGDWQTPLSAAEYSQLYATCYNMCTQKPPNNWAEQLYNRYAQSIKEYLQRAVLPAIQDKHDEPMLHEFVKRWQNHKVMVRFLTRLFTYLDRFYVKRVSAPTLNEVGVNSFLEIVFDQVKARMLNSILQMISRERNNETVDRHLLKVVIQIFVELGQDSLTRYQLDFEEQYLQTTGEYYTRQSAMWIGEDSCPEFLRKAERAIEDELQRVSNYLHPETTEKMLKVVEEKLLAAHQQALLHKEETGCEALLRDNKTDELARMYRLFNRLQSGLLMISDIVKKHITDVGMAIVKTYLQQGETKKESQQSQYIQELLNIHDKYLELVTNCFSGNQLFHKAMKEAFETFVNKDIDKYSTAELISNFCDVILKKTGEKMGEKELEETLEKVVKLFTYLSDKDLFAEFYRKQLAKRLLLARSASDDAERSLIQKLKYRCGAQFTSKLEGMVNDIGVSSDHQKVLSQYLQQNNINVGPELSVTVLTTGFWPTYKSDDITLPQELACCVQEFTKFYETRTSHRRLRWVHTLGTAHLVGHFDAKKIDLVVSTYQACILMLFNGQNSYTMSEILQAVKLPESELKRYLGTLIGAEGNKHKILTKVPDNPKDLQPDDVYTFNNAFNDKARKIKMSLLVTKVSQEEKAATKATVNEDRKHAVEAAIVRVMKSRRQLDHNMLITQVSQQLMQHFKPDPKIIKKRIEDLIQREYIERDKDKAQNYRYLA